MAGKRSRRRSTPEPAEIEVDPVRLERVEAGGRREGELADVGTSVDLVEVDPDEAEALAEGLREPHHRLQRLRPRGVALVGPLGDRPERLVPVAVHDPPAVRRQAAVGEPVHVVDATLEHPELVVVGKDPGLADPLLDDQARAQPGVLPLAAPAAVGAAEPTLGLALDPVPRHPSLGRDLDVLVAAVGGLDEVRARPLPAHAQGRQRPAGPVRRDDVLLADPLGDELLRLDLVGQPGQPLVAAQELVVVDPLAVRPRAQEVHPPAVQVAVAPPVVAQRAPPRPGVTEAPVAREVPHPARSCHARALGRAVRSDGRGG